MLDLIANMAKRIAWLEDKLEAYLDRVRKAEEQVTALEQEIRRLRAGT